MNFLSGMNKALEYIEDNLTGEIDYDKVAAFTGYSAGYFQRVFMCISGITLNEYVRRRKMTLASLEIQNSNIKIIDLAIKYGYESADSFARAFKKVHGVNPSKVRNKGLTLKLFFPIRFHISVEGVVEMNYRIEKWPEFRIVGKMRHFKAPENSEKDVDTFWNEVFKDETYDDIAKLSNHNPRGVHGFIQVKDKEKVDYMIAAVTDKAVPAGMEEYLVPESEWAIFETVGPVQKSLECLWKRIFDEWLPSSNYKHAETIEIECFKHEGNRGANDFKCEIWIPICKK